MDTFEENTNLPQPEAETSQEAPGPQEEIVAEEPVATDVPVAAAVSVEETVTEEPMAEESAPEEPSVEASAPRKASPYADSPYVMATPPARPQPPKTQKKSRKTGKGTPLWLTIVLVLVGCLITAGCVNSYWQGQNTKTMSVYNGKLDDLQRQIQDSVVAPGSNGTSRPVEDGSAMTPSQLYAECVDSVVAISTTVQSFYYGQAVEGSASGSGFVLTEDGYVVTNYHVVEDATAVWVTTYDGNEYEATVVGHDSGNDVAVLKVEAEGLAAAQIGSSGELNIGDMVAAIGNPLGTLSATQTVGYVSGINREVSTDSSIINMIQTDCAINPGNSGGPLFNMYGQVIGITTAKYSGTTDSGASIEGIGFAIPVDDVMGMIGDLMDYGYVTGAYLGVTVQNNDAESAAKFGLPTTGAYVLTVEAGGAADRAGIQPKDLIVKLGSYNISTITDLTRSLRNFKAGDTTTVTVIRGGQELELGITLDEKPHNTQTPTTPAEEYLPSEGDFEEWYDYFRRYFGE